MRKLKNSPRPPLLEITEGRRLALSAEGVGDLIKALGPIKFVLFAGLASISWLAYCLLDKGITTNLNVNLGLSISKRGGKPKIDEQ